MTEEHLKPRDTPDDDAWPNGFDGHQRAQRRRMAALSLEAKLDWLEAAHRVVMALQDENKRAKLQSGTSDHDNPNRQT